MTSLLSVKGISKSFAGRTVVDNVSFDVGQGEVVCLLGGSGSGKSTTLRIAAGIERPELGEVAVDGVTVESAAIFVPPEKRHVGLVFQDLALFPHLNARANAAFGLFRLSKAEANARADELLKTVGLSHLATAFPHQLSGGEQQRLAVARALAPRPKAMLLDEPFSGLDERLRDDVRRDVLGILKGQGAATLLVTHDPDEALRFADRIVLLRAGRIVQAGTPAELFAAPADIDTAAFFSPINRIATVVANGAAATPYGAIPAPGHADGDKVIAILRPRDLERAGEGGAPLTVRAVQTASDGIHVEGDTLRAVFDGGAPIRAGEVIGVRLRAGQGMVFPAPPA
ncbi:Fe(3+) ions import ATP-binding protein FbpC 2 [Alphaproteobacteria bacterium SO-S41]|nr:Fe(3+) ions import ATP-binding protein FbpC 2 [Alphaproteobacteria bacterium SO-S41]